MDCKKCKKMIPDESEFCPYCGKPVQKPGKGRAKLLLMVLLPLLVVGVVLAVLLVGNQEASGNGEGDSRLLAYLKERGTACGYENAFAEMSQLHATKTGELTYTRFQQNYKGMPVYGRTVVCATDGTGEILSVTGNVADVDAALSLTPSVTEAQATQTITEYLELQINVPVTELTFGGLQNDKLCIYSMDDLPDTLAYSLETEFLAEDIRSACRLIIDAQTGQVLWECRSSNLYGNFSGRTVDYTDVPYVEEDGKYYLWDRDRQIYVAKAVNKRYFSFKDPDKQVYQSMEYVTWEEGSAPLRDAVDAYMNVANAYDYFAESFNCYGPEGTTVKGSTKPTSQIAVTIGCEWVDTGEKGKGGKNMRGNADAVGCPATEERPAFARIRFGLPDIDVPPLSVYPDATAHEYAHTVEQLHADLLRNRQEPEAICEAFADIMGEMAAAWKSGQDPDWLNPVGYGRSMCNPEETGHCASLLDETYDKNLGWHYAYSTVISHAAYLMWESGEMSLNDFGKLWYNAMLMMPSDCTFYECRELVELAARHLKYNERVQTAIDDAFDQVGVITDDEVVELEVGPKGSLQVLDFAGEVYDRYSLRLWALEQYAVGGDLRLYPIGRKPDTQIKVENTAGYELGEREGVWLLEIGDLEDPQKREQFFLAFTAKEGAGVQIPTDFGTATVSGTVTLEKTGEPVFDAKVTVSGPGGTYVGTTDENGAYTIEKIPGGVYTHASYKDSKGKVTLYDYSIQATGALGQSDALATTLKRRSHADLVIKSKPAATSGLYSDLCNNIAYSSLAPAFGEDWIYYCHDDLHRVDYNGENDTVILRETTEYLNLYGDWLYFEGSERVRQGVGHRDAIKRLNVQDGTLETVFVCEEDDLDEQIHNLIILGDNLFYVREDEHMVSMFVEYIHIPTNQRRQLLGVNHMSTSSTNPCTIDFNYDGENIYIHVQNQNAHFASILYYRQDELKNISGMEWYGLDTEAKRMIHRTEPATRLGYIFCEGGYVLFSQTRELRVYAYADLLAGNKEPATTDWDVFQEGERKIFDIDVLEKRHYIVGDSLLALDYYDSDILYLPNDPSRKYTCLEPKVEFNAYGHCAGVYQDKLYVLFGYYEDYYDRYADPYMLTILADGQFTETFVS